MLVASVYDHRVKEMRFQIEEMLSQDANGAVFLAMDSATGKEVRLERFFPFGAGAGGLEGEELGAYSNAVESMKAIQHRSLLRVLDGGCDPVDGIPYLVTQGMDGLHLADFFSAGPITPIQGRELAESALEIMEIIEQRFGTGADWLVLKAEHVDVCNNGEFFRFAVDPMKWLGLKKSQGGVRELAILVENAMGWSGRVIAGSSVSRLSGWVRSAKAEKWNSAQALAALRGETIPVPAPTIASDLTVSSPQQVDSTVNEPAYSIPHQPFVVARPRSKKWPMIFGGLVAIGLIAFTLVQLLKVNPLETTVNAISNQKSMVSTSGEAIASSGGVTPQSTDDQRRIAIEKRAREMQENAVDNSSISESPKIVTKTPEVKKPEPEKPKVEEPEEEKPKVAKRDGDYKPEETELIAEQEGEEISVLGVIAKVQLSSSGKTLYVIFDIGNETVVRGRYMTTNGKEGMSVSELGVLEGTKVRITGRVMEEFGTKRCVIDLGSRTQIVEEP